MKKLLKCRRLLVCSVSLVGMFYLTAMHAFGQLSLTSGFHTQNFNSMSGATATLPTGFRVNTSANWSTGSSATTQAAGTTGTGALTGSSSGGTYNFANGVTASSTDRALGFLNSGSFTSPRNILFAFTNNTGKAITSLHINFDYEKYRSGSRAFNWTFFHGSTATAVATAATAGDQAYAADANNTVISNPPTTISKSFTITGLSIATGTTYYLAWTLTGVGGSSNGQGIGIDNFTLIAENEFTGTTNTNFSTATNWNSGIVPIAGANVLVTNTANKPSLTGNISLNDLTINSGGRLDIGANTLTLNGSLSGTGTLRGGSTSNLTIGGSGTLGTLLMDQSTPGTTNVLNNLTMNRASQTLTLGDTLRIAGTLTPTAGTVASDGYLKLVSNASGNARVAEVGGAISGNVTVERYIRNNKPDNTGGPVYRRWRFFSLPVSGTSLRQFFTGKTNIGDNLTNAGDATQNNVGTLITGHRRSAAGAGFDYWTDLPTTASSSIRYYTPANGFSSASNTPDVQSTSPDQQGYLVFIRGDRRNTLTTSNTNVTTLPSLGALRTGNQTITIPSQTYAALGNPYVSPIDFVAVRANTGNAALIQDRFWMWDPHLATAGGWRLVKQVSGNWRAVPTPFGDGDPADEGNVQHIQPGQAVLVEPTAAGTLLIEENDKSTNTGNTTIRPFETTASDAGVLEVNLSQADNGKFNLADGILATVAGNLSESINDADDVLKVGNTFSALGLALVRQNSRLATEGRPASLATDTLFLQTTGLAANQLYRFSVNATGAALANKTIQLIDQFANTTINLPVGAITQVEFTPTTDLNSTANTRFLIVLNNNNTLPVSFTRIAAREQQGNVEVEWTVAAETGVKHYEIEHSTNGRDFGKAGLVRARNNGAATYSFIHQQPGSGNHYYRLRSEDADGKSQLTQVVKVTLGSSQKGFGVYPTLVSGNRLTVEFNGLSKGRYTLQLNDMAGKMLMNTAIQHEGGSAAQNLQLPAGLAAGTYLIRLQGEGSSYSQKIVKE